MNSTTVNTTHEYRPMKYFVMTFVTTFVLWFIGAYFSYQEGKEGLYILFMLPGLMAPFIISTAMILRSKDPALRKDFVNRLLNLRLLRPATLPVLVLLMPLAVLASIGLSLLFGGSVEQLQLAEGFSFSVGFVPVLFVLLLAAAFEELGWRGYAFDSLQSRYTYFKATIIFSVLWGLWHVPLLFVKDSYQYEIFNQNPWFAVNFFVSIIPMGVIISWACLRNGKSVLAAIAFHFIINMSQEALAITQSTKAIETVVLTAVAIGIIILDREMFFSKSHLGDASRSVAAPRHALTSH